jgi:hypothetical protein
MKSWVWSGMLVAAVAFPTSYGMAREEHHENEGCTNATINGDYAFAVNTWTSPPSQIRTPGFVVGLTGFDGHGKLTQIDYPVGSATPETRGKSS